MVGLSIAVTLLCAFLLVQKNREVEAARLRLETLDRQRELAAAEAEAKDRKANTLYSRLRETRAEARANALEAQTLRDQKALARPERKPHADLSQIFRDAAMKGVLEDEAKAGVARNVDALFKAGLAQHLQLNDQRTLALKQLLTQKASLFWEKMLVPMMTGELDETQTAQSGKALRQAVDENAAQIRALVGNDGYEAVQWFDKTQPDRDNLKQFNPSFEESGHRLSAEQQNQLLSLMIGERLGTQFQFDLGDPAKLDFEHWYDNFTDDKILTYAAEMEQMNDRIVQQAQGVLTPEQNALFKTLLQQQLQRAKFTARMTTATFARQR